MRRAGNFIVIDDTWLNIKHIVSVMARIDKKVNAKDIEIVEIPDGLDITLTSGKGFHVFEKAKKEFLALLEEADS